MSFSIPLSNLLMTPPAALPRVLVFFLACCAGAPAAPAAEDPNVLFTVGNRAFEAGRYAEAERSYRAAVDTGLVSEEGFFNLGNALYRQDRLGEAALWYRRTLVLDPRFAEARQNLRVVQHRTGYHEFEREGIDGWLARLQPGELAAAFSAAAWIALLALAAGITVPRLREWRPLLWTVASVAALAAGAVAWAWQRTGKELDASRLAIVIGPDAAALVSPAPDAEKVVDLPPGSELQLIQRRGPWTYVGIPRDLRGWMRSENLAPVHWHGPLAAPEAEPGLAARGR